MVILCNYQHFFFNSLNIRDLSEINRGRGGANIELKELKFVTISQPGI